MAGTHGGRESQAEAVINAKVQKWELSTSEEQKTQ